MSSFAQHLQGLMGKYVSLGRKGDSKGFLVAAKEDYLTLYCVESNQKKQDGKGYRAASTEESRSSGGTLVHYPLYHLKSLAEINEEDASGAALDLVPAAVAETLPATFWELMKSHHGKKVTLYDHGPESATGWMFECGDDYVKLLVTDGKNGEEEMVNYPFFHIKSVSLARSKKKNSSSSNSGNNARGSGEESSGGNGREMRARVIVGGMR